jgi:hypothetical protein
MKKMTLEWKHMDSFLLICTIYHRSPFSLSLAAALAFWFEILPFPLARVASAAPALTGLANTPIPLLHWAI